jgi:hypothetical protein
MESKPLDPHPRSPPSSAPQTHYPEAAKGVAASSRGWFSRFPARLPAYRSLPDLPPGATVMSGTEAVFEPVSSTT